MRISTVKVGDETKNVLFYRHNLSFELGFGRLRGGFVYQYATKSADTRDGRADSGVMATAGYSLLLSSHLSADFFGRLGLGGNHDFGQPLYATDTDLRAKLVLFDPDGWGPIDSAFFPSAYLGSIVNSYGRVQALGGAGLWWQHIGFYFTGIFSFNGVQDPLHPGPDADRAFADLKNSSVNLSASYELDVSSELRLRIEVRQNVPFENSGNDTTLVLEMRQNLPNDRLP